MIWRVSTAVIGVALFAWTIVRVGPSTLVQQIPALHNVLTIALGLAAFRFALQAIGWRMAMAQHDSLRFGRALLAVIAGEGAGYLTWGPISREPVKALMVRQQVSPRISLPAAVIERTLYAGAAAGLGIAGLIGLAIRTNHAVFVPSGLVILAIGAVAAIRWRPPSVPVMTASATSIMIALVVLQEITNVFEAYVILGWLGAGPTVENAVMFEGLNRLVNSAGAFVPGRLGVSEMAAAGFADAMSLGSVHGLTLALTRRLRSLLWAAVGALVLAFSSAYRLKERSTAADPVIARSITHGETLLFRRRVRRVATRRLFYGSHADRRSHPSDRRGARAVRP
jgi:hypothetical protein